MVSQEHAWKILEEHWETVGFVEHQKESFNNFILHDIPRILHEVPDVVARHKNGIEHRVAFHDPYVEHPSIIEADHTHRKVIYPAECRERNLTYSSTLYVNITETFSVWDKSIAPDTKVRIKEHRRVPLANIPIMLQTYKCHLFNCTPQERISHDECPYDEGGYFICGGNEQCIISQMRKKMYNKVLVLENNATKKYSHTAEVRSMSEETGHSAVVEAYYKRDEDIVLFSFPNISTPLPAGVVFKAMGLETLDQMRDCIGLYHEKFEPTLRKIYWDSWIADCQDAAIDFIGARAKRVMNDNERHAYAWQVIESDLFPHIGITAKITEKTYFLGHIVNKLLSTVFGFRQPDNLDDYINRRVEPPGYLLYELFRSLFKQYMAVVRTNLENNKERFKIPKSTKISKGLLSAMTLGNWGAENNKYMKVGVAQPVSRLTFGASLSHLRRIMIQAPQEGQNNEIRQIDSSQIMFVCPSECFDPSTPILLWDGTIKRADQIKVGDILIDDIGNRTRVRKTCKGMTTMYKVSQHKTGWMDYTVTDNHILTLCAYHHGKVQKIADKWRVTCFDSTIPDYVHSYFDSIEEADDFLSTKQTSDVIDITIEQYLKLPEHTRDGLHGIRVHGVNWTNSDAMFDPYYLGMWLGGQLFPEIEILPSKQIPPMYISTNRHIRLSILAGIIDGVGTVHDDGKRVVLTLADEDLMVDVRTVARSLGLICNYCLLTSTVTISGYCLGDIPTKSRHIKLQSTLFSECKEELETPIEVSEVGIGPFVGWQLEGNGRFLLGDLTVVHNTPEGKQVGYVMNLASTTKITSRTPTVEVRDIVERYNNLILLKDFTGKNNLAKVFLNGLLLGFTEDMEALMCEVRASRHARLLPYDLTVGMDDIDREVFIYSDEGRLIRPLFKVEDNQLLIKEEMGRDWDTLLRSGVLQFVDHIELNCSNVAMTQKNLEQTDVKWDFCEIEPAVMFGTMASVPPFPNHSQGPRVCYQCLHPDTEVHMADGSCKAIRDVRVDDMVKTVDPVSCRISTTRVINQYVKPSTKPIIRLETESGRTLYCTEDHPVLTSSGWKPACEAYDIYVVPQQDYYEGGDPDIEIELPRCTAKDKHTRTLCEMGLFPVSGDKLPIIARMVGYLLSNGWVELYEKGPQVQFVFGSQLGRDEFLEDVRVLGFKNKVLDHGYVEGFVHCWQVIYNNALASLLVAMIEGYTGKRTTQHHPPLPDWIMNGSPMVKREFLAGFQGGDGCTIRYNPSKKGRKGVMILNSTSQTSRNEHVESLVFRMGQYKALMEEFGIKCTEPTVRDAKCPESKQVHVYFSNTRENLLAYVERIGWRYDHHKLHGSVVSYEYLRMCQHKINSILSERTEVRGLIASGMGVADISKKLSWSYRYTADTVAQIRNNTKPSLPKGFCQRENWNREMKNGGVFVRVSYVESCDTDVADITTESENHSFLVSGGLCVHNSSMGKQAMGLYATTYRLRTDTTAHVMEYPQEPLVYSRISKAMGFKKMASGVNAIVAVLPYGGFGQEDSVILNQSALERGLFGASTYKTYTEVQKKLGTHSDIKIGLCPPEVRRKDVNYSLLDEDGAVRTRIGPRAVYVQKGDVIIGKYLKKADKDGNEDISDCSLVVKHGEEGYIDRVYKSVTPDGWDMVRVVIRTTRFPRAGDKLAARSGQKGTIGMVFRQEDMPFTCDGIIPDIILNPLALPSRMTINQLMECALGKICTATGEDGDATAYAVKENYTQEINNKLVNLGFHSWGNEPMACGLTGELLECDVFIGPTYYQRLKHLVDDKIHARARGKVTKLYRQAPDGRGVGGGLRLGEINWSQWRYSRRC